ncbi:MAG: polysaccharide-degrading enzyme [Acidobacteriota bacterium]
MVPSRSRFNLGSMALLLALAVTPPSRAAVYEVGPDKPLANVGDVPWESLVAGDTVLVYHRPTPYKEKFLFVGVGTPSAPITVRGVPGPGGELPVLDGNGATTRSALNYYSQERGVIKIGGATTPFVDGISVIPQWLVLENLEIRSARPPYTFTKADGSTAGYTTPASAIYLEYGEHIVVRNCILRDCANGFFSFSSDTKVSKDVLVEGCYIFDNGNDGSLFEHNVYTESLGIVFQYNHLGPLRSGASGNNLKDRSAGTVIRYNWIEGGNRQLDLVNAEDSSILRADPSYREAFVYGNILIEPDAAGNRQVAHYGGDTGPANKWRKGTLYFYNNTMVSYRTDKTTWFRLSSNDENCDARNNIVYVTSAGSNLSMIDDKGVLTLSQNWFKPGWTNGPVNRIKGTVINNGNVEGASVGFVDEAGQDFHLAAGSANINTGTLLNPAVLPLHDLVREYIKHQSSAPRVNDGSIDIGAFERP